MQNPRIHQFTSREDAGRQLANRLNQYAASHDVLVLGLPIGGATVGAAIASSLHLPFDVLLVGKITAPACGGMPLGAITHGGVRNLNDAMIHKLHLSNEDVSNAVLHGCRKLARREMLYRGRSAPPDVADHTVILADDGSSPVSVIRDAVRLLRRMHAERVIVALPTASHHAARELRLEADEVVNLSEPESPIPPGKCFKVFPRPSHTDIRRLLAEQCPIAGVRN